MGGLVGLVDMDKQAGQGFGGRGIGQFPRIHGAATAVLHQLHHFLTGLQVVTGHQDIAVDLHVLLQQVGGYVVVCRSNPRPVAHGVTGDNRDAPLPGQLDYGYFRRHQRYRGINQYLPGQARPDALQGGLMGSVWDGQDDDFRLFCRGKVVSAPDRPGAGFPVEFGRRILCFFRNPGADDHLVTRPGPAPGQAVTKISGAAEDCYFLLVDHEIK